MQLELKPANDGLFLYPLSAYFVLNQLVVIKTS